MELLTLIMYDIENDCIRRKVAEDCKDSGLERVQYSVFRELMTRTRRGELVAKLRSRLGAERVMANVLMSRITRLGGHLGILDKSGVVGQPILAELRYNLTSDENLPDEEGTETLRTSLPPHCCRTDENLPDEEGTETSLTA